jgi:hypothetical protein
MDKVRRLFNESKKIKKRIKILKMRWQDVEDIIEDNPLLSQPHRLHKINLNCGCKRCHPYKNIGNSKKKLSYKDKKLKLYV